MSKLDIIQEIINEEFICDKGFLEEKQPQFVMKIDFDDRDSEDKVVYRFDKVGVELFPYFKKKSDLNKLCDYFIFFERKQKLYILICELKKGVSNKATANKQLKAGRLFIDYLIRNANRIGKSIPLEEIVFYELRFIDANITKFSKRTTKSKNVLHGENEGVYEYRSRKLRFVDFK